MTERGEEPDHDEREGGRGEELRPEDVDRRFNELIKGLDDPVAELPRDAREEREEEPPEPAPAEDEPNLLELWDADLPEDEDDEYRAPDPPPIPWPSLRAVGGLLLLIGGIALVVNPGIAPLGTNPGRLVGFIGFLIGVWLLISLLRPDRDEDDTDDGAVV